MEASNQNINNMIRRATNVGQEDRSMSSITINLKKIIRELIYSKKFFFVSFFFVVIFFIFLKIVSNEVIVTLQILESQDMIFIYFTIFAITSFITWSFFLMFSVFVSRAHYVKSKSDLILTVDLLYFNPILFTFMIYYYNSSFVGTSFDIFAWIMISTQYFINFCFSILLFKYANYRISQITNFSSPENKFIIYRFRLNYFVLIVSNIAFSYMINLGIKETNFMYKYFILLKGLYLFLKHIEFIIINELNYKELVWNINIKEKNILLTLSIKCKIQIINMVIKLI
jgi:hypothetical protein